MRSTQRAWRTAASRGRIFGGPPAAAVDAPSQAAAMPSVQPDDLALGKPWQQVGWSLPLIGLLIYLVTVVTYRIQLGQEAIIIALIGVALQREALRFPPFPQ